MNLKGSINNYATALKGKITDIALKGAISVVNLTGSVSGMMESVTMSIAIRSRAIMSALARVISRHSNILINSKVVVEASLYALRKLYMDINTRIQITVTGYVLKKVSTEIKNRSYIGRETTLDDIADLTLDDLSERTIEDISFILGVMINIVRVLKNIEIKPRVEITVDAVTLRHRTLNDIGEMTLDELGEMTLNEIAEELF